jgi:hypothetical protein
MVKTKSYLSTAIPFHLSQNICMFSGEVQRIAHSIQISTSCPVEATSVTETVRGAAGAGKL